MTPIRFIVLRFLYRHLIKLILFRFDPEDVHEKALQIGQYIGRHKLTRFTAKRLCAYEHNSLMTTVDGIHYRNPIGLAAGFDKNAQLTEVLPSIGFGFEEIGSITAHPCEGNPRPRLWGLPHSHSLVVNYGLKNKGADTIKKQLEGKIFDFPIGISIAKTNNSETVDTSAAISDYGETFKLFTSSGIGNYITLNISCPNSFGGESFTDPDKLDKLLASIAIIPHQLPIYIKLPAELSRNTVDSLIEVADKYSVQGFICANLAKQRNNPLLRDAHIPQHGGISGKATQDLSDNLIAYLYKKTKGAYTIIGCGGVSCAQDAYRKIRLGASLIQLITGMIYEGPQVIGEINYGLTQLLRRDGFRSVREAVGSGLKITPEQH